MKTAHGFASLFLPTYRRGLPAWARWPLHLLGLAVFLAVCIYLNHRWDVERRLRAPFPELGRYWLPLIVICIYLLFWLGVGLAHLLRLPPLHSDFVELESAWKEAVTALCDLKIDVSETPLFLVLGKPAGGYDALLQAAGFAATVKRDGPFHVFASPEAIFLACDTTSLLGDHADRLSKKPWAGAEASENRLDEVQRIGSLVAIELAGQPVGSALEGVAVERRRARFEYLCRLVARHGRPINGMVCCLPFSATSTLAAQAAACLQYDLRTARHIFRVDCPTYVIVCDLEKVRGCAELISQLPPSHRQAMLGRRFPLVPDIDPADMPAMIDSGLAWLCDTLLPWYVYSLFRFESGAGAKAALDENARLCQLLDLLRQRRPALSAIVTEGTRAAGHSPHMLAGCFLAATGADAAREQAFVAEVIQDLLQNQRYVTWNEGALREDSLFRRLTGVGYAALGLGLMCIGAYYLR